MALGSVTCPSCGAQVAAGNRYCTSCGKSMDAARFCGQCGSRVEPGVKFCGKCGAAAAQTVSPAPAAQTGPSPAMAPAPAPAAPPISKSEPVLGVIAGAQRRKGLLGVQTYNVVVTSERLVFAVMTDKMMKDAVQQASERAKAEGKGLLGRIAAQMGWLNLMVQRYAAMSPDTALAENRDNFFLPNSTISKLRVEEDYDSEDGKTETKLKIEAISGKFEFKLTAGNAKEARQLLRNAIGAAVR